MVSSCGGCLQKRSDHPVQNQIRSHHPEASSEDYGLCTRPDHGFCCLLGHPFPGLGDCRPSALMDAMLALLPEDETPGSLFLGLFLERFPIKMSDHLVSREFKNPSEMALYADSLWDARKAIPTDHLLATALTSSSFPVRGRAQDRRSPSQTAKVKPQVHQSLNVISTNVLVLQPTIVALLAVSRETPEKIKQSSHRRLSHVP